MLFSEENRFIHKLYSDVLLENPDTLTIGDDYYSYDDASMGNITGVMNNSGKFVMSQSLIGHYNLLEAISFKKLDEVNDLKHNFSSFDEIYAMSRYNWQKFRIWPKFKVFSLWMRHLRPEYKPAIDNILSALGDANHQYKFDLNLYDDKFVTYDELMNRPLSDEEKAEMEADARRKAEDQRKLADAMLGNDRKRSIDLDIFDNAPQKVPAWQRRDGD
jgi:hypothetical protein